METSISYQQDTEVACSPLTVSCHSDIASAENILTVTLVRKQELKYHNTTEQKGKPSPRGKSMEIDSTCAILDM